MCANFSAKWLMPFGLLLSLSLSCLRAQDLPKSEDSFDVEPPLLVLPGEPAKDANGSREGQPEEQPDIGKLEEQLVRAKKSSTSAERLVRMGVLAKAEAEQRALRVLRLEAALAKAQVVPAQEQVTVQQARLEAGEASKPDLDAATANLARINAAAQVATESYRQALLEAAALNLRRQRLLLSLGSARNSDVVRAEEKLATLQRGDQPAN